MALSAFSEGARSVTAVDTSTFASRNVTNETQLAARALRARVKYCFLASSLLFIADKICYKDRFERVFEVCTKCTAVVYKTYSVTNNQLYLL